LFLVAPATKVASVQIIHHPSVLAAFPALAGASLPDSTAAIHNPCLEKSNLN
jgi:hypothetical protein